MSTLGRNLDSGIAGEKQRLADATGQDDAELLGYAVSYTVGADYSVLVPRSWLLDEMRSLGLPRAIAPPEPTPRKAYSRTIDIMRDFYLDSYAVEMPRRDNEIPEPHDVEVYIRDGDGSRVHKVIAEVFRDEEESGVNGGMWEQHQLGTLRFDEEQESLVGSVADSLGPSHRLFDVWLDVRGQAQTYASEIEQMHNASDIRNMIYNQVIQRGTQHVVKLQRSLYLFPADMVDFIEDLAELFRRIDEDWKQRGDPLRIRTIEVLNTEQKREWVEDRVRATLEDAVDSILNEAFDEFDEGEAASSVVRTIRQNLDEHNETAAVYNSLLEAEIDIEEELERRKQQVADEQKERIIDRALDQHTVTEFSG